MDVRWVAAIPDKVSPGRTTYAPLDPRFCGEATVGADFRGPAFFFGVALRGSDFLASDFVPADRLFDDAEELDFFAAPDECPRVPAFLEQDGQAPHP